jgi:aryl-alcohol dehydrogenase-like predicted oxidoreductase
MRLFEPRRELGRTGFRATLRRALDAGLNVIDTAPNYEEGLSEEIVGIAVADRRDQVFVISKVDDLLGNVEAQIEGSLARLRLERTDAFVFHNVSRLDDWRHIAAAGGSLDQLYVAVSQGRTRFRGISSHHPDVLHAALDDGRCDLVMFPVGPFVDPRYVDEILPRAKALGVGTVCFKTFGAGKLLGDTSGYNQPLQVRPRGKLSSGGVEGGEARLPRLSVSDCLHYTLTLDPDVALLGMSFPNEQDAAFEAARSFRPLGADQLSSLRARAADAMVEKGAVWWNPDR